MMTRMLVLCAVKLVYQVMLECVDYFMKIPVFLIRYFEQKFIKCIQVKHPVLELYRYKFMYAN